MTGPGRDALAALILAFLAWLVPSVAARFARPALVDFGPNDAEYVTGFRADWEREGRTRFHWTTPQARVTIPLHARGPNLKLYLRLRRHFTEPAHVTLNVEGHAVARFDLQVDPRVAYRVLEVALPRLDGRLPFALDIAAPSDNPRPLGIALDWMELRQTGPGARFSLPARTRALALLAVLLAFLAPRLVGCGRALAFAHGAVLSSAIGAGTLWDVVAAERIVRLGAPVYFGVALLAVAVAGWPRARAALQMHSRALAAAVVVIVLVALAIRLSMLLHPRFFYPDVRVHARFAWQLAKDGLPTFLSEFTVNQYRHSLGLQLENGHWYAFPYPPAFYVLCWPLLALAHYRPEAAVAIVGAVVNSLEALLVFAIARRLTRSPAAGLAAAALVPLLPIFLARLSLAYFPALVGHAVDAIVILYLLSRLEKLDRPRVVAALGGLVAVALLTYTQSLLNFGILLPLLLALQVGFDRHAGARRRQAGLAAAGALGVVLALVAFYGRYVPIFLDMQRGIPMSEERVLLERMETERASDPESSPEPPDDPYAGPGVDLVRGLQKAGSRLLIFYSGFAPLVVAGVVWLGRHAPGPEARLVAAWGLTYLVLNLASGGLPGPNLVRYNKDLEIVAPLCCAGLAALGVGLWERTRAGAVVATGLGCGFVIFGAMRAVRYLTEKFVVEG